MNINYIFDVATKMMISNGNLQNLWNDDLMIVVDCEHESDGYVSSHSGIRRWIYTTTIIYFTELMTLARDKRYWRSWWGLNAINGPIVEDINTMKMIWWLSNFLDVTMHELVERYFFLLKFFLKEFAKQVNVLYINKAY